MFPTKSILQTLDGPATLVAEIAELLENPDWSELAARRLGSLGDTGLPYLQAALNHVDIQVRANALLGIGDIAFRFATEQPAVIDCLMGFLLRTPDLQIETTAALAQFGSRSRKAIPLMLEYLDSENAVLVEGAVRVIDAVGSPDADVAGPQLNRVIEKYQGCANRVHSAATNALSSIQVPNDNEG
jgi:HEAT repeat protein